MERTNRPAALDDRTQLMAALDYARATVRFKCEGISEELAHATPLITSPMMSIAGVVNHLRWVENGWIRVNLLGEPDLWPGSDDDPDGEFRIAAQMTIAEIMRDYVAECTGVNTAIAPVPLDTPLQYTRKDGFCPDLRWTILHLIDETARHNGHLDILREMADGSTGY